MIYKQKRTNKKIAEDLQNDKGRKKALSKKGGEREIKKYFNEWEENRRRMEKIRSNLGQEEKDLEKEKLRERVAKLRLKQSPEEREYNIIRKKIPQSVICPAPCVFQQYVSCLSCKSFFFYFV